MITFLSNLTLLSQMDFKFQIAEYGFRDQYYIHASSIWAWVNPGPTGT